MTDLQIQTEGALGRVLKVLRLTIVNPWPMLITPLIIVGILLGISTGLEILSSNSVEIDAEVWFAPEFFFIVYLFVIANQTMYQHYPMALSFGFTRTEFYFGVVGGYVLLALWYATLSIAISILRGTYFLSELSIFGVENFATLTWTYLTSQLMAGAVTAVYLRWRRVGMLSFFALLASLLVGLPVLISFLNGWNLIARLISRELGWLEATGIGGLILAFIGLSGYFTIRRASVR